MKGFVLGISSGISCVAYCMPVLFPFFLNKGQGVKKNFCSLVLFLGGRLAGYLLFGIAAWTIGRLFLEDELQKNIITGSTYIFTSTILFFEFFKEKRCLIKQASIFGMKLQQYTYLLPFILGLATGLNLCPTFLLVFTEAASLKNMLESILFFFFFFVGTTFYFFPIPFIGLLAKKEEVKIIGRFLIVMISVYYFCKGFITLINYGRF